MKHCVVLTGAGISADSGLKTFRDAGGLWEGYRVEDVATPEGFQRNPQLVIDFYNERRQQLKTAQPNAAHLALAQLEKYYQTDIITQNVDNLHERAGSLRVLHLHGQLTQLRSTRDASYIIDFEDNQTIDMCDPNGYPMRPHIVWFGEEVPALQDAIEITRQADILIIIGTSLKVYPAAGLMHFAPSTAEVYLIDPNPVALPNVHVISERAAVGVPQVVEQLIQAA